MTEIPGIPLYNPDRQSDGDFVEYFVARGEQFDLIMKLLRRQALESGGEHQLIVGQRGMGKSTLLRRIAIGINHDEELAARLLSLRFREEQYNVINLTRFWRNCGDALAQWCEDNGRADMATCIDAALGGPAWAEASAADTFLALCAELNRRAVLLLDNIDLILDALRPEEQWALRRTLQAANGPLVIGAATSFLATSGDRQGAFYEFFHPHVLEPLSEAELMRCMRALADLRGPLGEPVRRLLKNEPERLRTLYALTGGNPRVLALIYRIIERGGGDTTFADLEALLEEVTPYYKARVEEYTTPQQRAVIDAIALRWDPVSSRGIADATGIEVTTVSTHLSRLKRDGFVEEVSTSGSRAGYQITERFLNIWYLMRHGSRRARQRLDWLTKFLTRFYIPDEIDRLAAEAKDKACDWHPHYREAVLAAYDEIHAILPKEVPAVAQELETAMALVKQASQLAFKEENILAGLQALDIFFTNFDASPLPGMHNLIALALHIKATCFGRLDRCDDSIAAYDEVVARFGGAPESDVRIQVAEALFSKGCSFDALGQSEKAIAAYDEVVARFGSGQEPYVRFQVAKAFVNKGACLAELSRSEEAIAAYDEGVARFSGDPEPNVRGAVARALLGKGGCLAELSRREEAIAAYDEVASRFSGSQEPDVRFQVARALFSKGRHLAELSRSEEAIAAYSEAAARFSGDPEPNMRKTIAMALFNKGCRLAELSRSEEAIAAYDEVVARFSGDPDTNMRETIARALLSKGGCLAKLGRSEEAIAAYGEVAARFSGGSEPDVRALVARALLSKGGCLAKLGRSEEAIAAYGEVAARFSGGPEPDVRALVARALFDKGGCLAELSRREEAIAAYDEVATRFSGDPEPNVRKAAIAALCNKGNLLFDALGKAEAAEAAYHAALDVDETSLVIRANLSWIELMTGHLVQAKARRAGLMDLSAAGLALLDAALALADDNFGLAIDRLGSALADEVPRDFFDDLLRFLRLAETRGYGEKVIGWMETSGASERLTPVYAAFIAFVRGERCLLDVNPEIRHPARDIFARLTAPRRTVPPTKLGPGGQRRKKQAPPIEHRAAPWRGGAE